jgi:hypothetical protein
MPPTVFISPLSILISLAAVFGVFMHDSQFDNILMTALSAPAITADYNNNVVNLMPGSHHIQSESSPIGSSFSLRVQQPAAQPRNEDDKKYIAQRRIMGNTFGNDYYWPSI